MRLPVTISLRPSRRMLLWLGCIHLVAMLTVWTLALPPLFRSALAFAIAASGLHAWWRHRHPVATALHFAKAGVIEVEMAAGRRDPATVLAQTTVLPGLTVLLLRLGGRTIALPLPTDATGAEAHRQLRLWLRWQSTSP